MLSSASDFWLLFWTIIGSGVALTVVSSIAIATFRPSWLLWPSGSGRRELAAVHHLFAGGSRQARRAA